MFVSVPSLIKLGKLPAKHDVRTLRLEDYVSAFPPPPVSTSNRNSNILRTYADVLGNDTHGCCVVSGDGHREELESNLAGKSFRLATADVLAEYQKASIALNHSAADQGLYVIDYLKWRRTEAWYSNRAIFGFAGFDPRNRSVTKQVVANFNSIMPGLALPLTAQDQWYAGLPWTVTSLAGRGQAGSWGGHLAIPVDYDANYLYISTWGRIQSATWQWWDSYCDEAYAVIPTDPVPGFDLAAFIADLKAIGAYIGPDAPPVPPQPVGPRSEPENRAALIGMLQRGEYLVPDLGWRNGVGQHGSRITLANGADPMPSILIAVT